MHSSLFARRRERRHPAAVVSHPVPGRARDGRVPDRLLQRPTHDRFMRGRTPKSLLVRDPQLVPAGPSDSGKRRHRAVARRGVPDRRIDHAARRPDSHQSARRASRIGARERRLPCRNRARNRRLRPHRDEDLRSHALPTGRSPRHETCDMADPGCSTSRRRSRSAAGARTSPPGQASARSAGNGQRKGAGVEGARAGAAG